MSNFSTAVNYSKASAGLRFANFLIDFIIYLVTWGFITFVSLVALGHGLIDSTFFNLLYLFYFVAYYTTQEVVFRGRTIGKFITGTVVVTADGYEPSPGKYLIRSLCRMIPFEAFSFLFSSESGWHDTLSNTRVVKIIEFEEMKIKYHGLDEIGKEWFKADENKPDKPISENDRYKKGL